MKRYAFLTFTVSLMVMTACAAPAQTPSTVAPAQTQIVPTLEPTLTLTRLPIATSIQDTNGAFNVKSESIMRILEQGPEAGKCLVYGVVRFAGQPIITYTDVPPELWVRDENAGNSVDTEVVYDHLYGEYLYSLRAGTYGISAKVVLGGSYPTPGDYTSFTQVTVEEGQPTLTQDLALTRIIHLASPFDNMEPWDIGFERKRPWDTPLLESNKVLFSWDVIQEASAYSLTITEIQYNPEKNLQWDNVQTYFDKSITETRLEIELPSSPEDHFYSARLYAIGPMGNHVGSLMIRLKNGGFGWDLRFRVP